MYRQPCWWYFFEKMKKKERQAKPKKGILQTSMHPLSPIFRI